MKAKTEANFIEIREIAIRYIEGRFKFVDEKRQFQE